jgi:hypothetical protein
MQLETKNYKFNFSFPTIIFALPTAIIGHSIHGDFWWTLFDLFLWPLVWIKWLICRDVNVTIIKNAFSWFLE